MASHCRCSRSSRCAAPFGEVDGARRQRLGVKGEPQHVEGLAEQPLRNALQQRRHHAVGRHQVPVPVKGQRRIRLMRLQHQVDRLPRRFQRGIVERALRKRRRKSGRDQQHVAFAQGHLQPLGQLQHHVARRRGAAGFDEAQMARRDLGIAGEIELAQMAALPPFAQVIADMDGLGSFGACRGMPVRSWWKTYHANFGHSITSEVKFIGVRTSRGLEAV